MTDTWRKTGDGWRLIGSQVLALHRPARSHAIGTEIAEYVGRYTLGAAKVYDILSGMAALWGRRPGVRWKLCGQLADLLFVPGKPPGIEKFSSVGPTDASPVCGAAGSLGLNLDTAALEVRHSCLARTPAAESWRTGRQMLLPIRNDYVPGIQRIQVTAALC